MTETRDACRTVVVGTDGSRSALRAVARAGSLAGATRRSRRDVLVVHTTD